MLLSHLLPCHSGLVRLLGPPWPAKEVLGAAQDQNDTAEGAIILHLNDENNGIHFEKKFRPKCVDSRFNYQIFHLPLDMVQLSDS